MGSPRSGGQSFQLSRNFASVCLVQDFGRLPFDQKFRGEFPEISMGKWYSLFPLWKTMTVRLEFFNDF